MDDGIIASNQQDYIAGFFAVLRGEFQIRSSLVERFVGTKIVRDRKHKRIHLSQPDYISEVVEKFQMAPCFPKMIPADPGLHLVKPDDGNPAETIFPFREAVGSLLYLALVTRPDISFAVGQVARFVESHNSSHVKAVRQIISYIKGTSSHGICFRGSICDPMIGYSDADWGGCHDSRRSTTGTIFMHHGGPIAWGSRRHTKFQKTAFSTEIHLISAAKLLPWTVYGAAALC